MGETRIPIPDEHVPVDHQVKGDKAFLEHVPDRPAAVIKDREGESELGGPAGRIPIEDNPDDLESLAAVVVEERLEE